MLENLVSKARSLILAAGISVLPMLPQYAKADSYIEDNQNATSSETKTLDISYWYGGDAVPKEEKAKIEVKTARDNAKNEMYLDLTLKNAPQFIITYYLHTPPYVLIEGPVLKSKPAKTSIWEEYIPLKRELKKAEQRKKLSETREFINREAQDYLFSETLGQIPLAGLLSSIKSFTRDLELNQLTKENPGLETKKIVSFLEHTEDEISLKFNAIVRTRELTVQDKETKEIRQAIYPPENTPAEAFASILFELLDSNLATAPSNQITISFQKGKTEINLESLVLNKYETPHKFILAKDKKTLQDLREFGFADNPSHLEKERLPYEIKDIFICVYKNQEPEEDEFRTFSLISFLSQEKEKASKIGNNFEKKQETEQIGLTNQDGTVYIKSIFKPKPDQSQEQLLEIRKTMEILCNRINREQNLGLKKSD